MSGMQVPEVYECGQVTNPTIAWIMGRGVCSVAVGDLTSLTSGFSNGCGI